MRNLNLYENPPDSVKALARELCDYLRSLRSEAPASEELRATSGKPVPLRVLVLRPWKVRIKVEAGSVCAAVFFARSQGWPIGSNSKGYYWATSAQELQATVDYIMGPLSRGHQTVGFLKRIQDNFNAPTAPTFPFATIPDFARRP